MSSAFVEPVLVFTMARSKSSWVTATVADALGAWVGACGGPIPGYPRGQLENQAIVAVQRRWFGRAWERAEQGLSCGTLSGFRKAVIAAITDDGYPGGPWVYKCSAWYALAFVDAFPGATLIAVRRDADAIVDSARRHRGRVPSRTVIAVHERALDWLVDECGALAVDPAARSGDLDFLHQWLAPEVAHGTG